MPTYWWVKNPDQNDISNSLLEDKSPFKKDGNDLYYLLGTNSASSPFGNGSQEYHADVITRYHKARKTNLKVPDALTRDEMGQRAVKLLEEFFDSDNSLDYGNSVDVCVALSDFIIWAERGFLAQARSILNDRPTSGAFNSAVKSSLLSEIDKILDDYPWVKDTTSSVKTLVAHQAVRLVSPNGTVYKTTVDNTGTLSTGAD